MALIARSLIDTSAAARMATPRVRDRLAPLINDGMVATRATLDSEALCSVPTPPNMSGSAQAGVLHMNTCRPMTSAGTERSPHNANSRGAGDTAASVLPTCWPLYWRGIAE
jgi:hypothetical protein